jgi:HrpA-like RNA helicase
LDKERQQLPAWSARERLVELVKENQVLIVIGETGSGKTTQVGAA